MQRTKANVGPRAESGDLQYYLHDGSGAFRFELVGNLSNHGARDLEQAWSTASSTIGDRKLIVDLTRVTAISDFGRELLLRWRLGGATLLAIGTESLALLESIPGLTIDPGVRDRSRRTGPVSALRLLCRVLGGLALLFPVTALARDMVTAPASGSSLALARYIMSTQENSLFHTSQPVILDVEASLPGLFKESRLIALRRVGDSGRTEYHLLITAGDVTVTQELIAPYLAIEDGIQELPASSVAVTPANYRFHYVGEVGTGAPTAYVFRITPKRKHDGLIEGQLWIDAVSGIGVLQAGHLVKTPSGFAPHIQVVRDTKLLNGVPCVRITHVSMKTRMAGSGELTVTEYRLLPAGEGAPSPPDPVGTTIANRSELDRLSH